MLPYDAENDSADADVDDNCADVVIEEEKEEGIKRVKKSWTFSSCLEVLSQISCGLCCWFTCGCVTLFTCWPVYFLYMRRYHNHPTTSDHHSLLLFRNSKDGDNHDSSSSLDDPLLVQKEFVARKNKKAKASNNSDNSDDSSISSDLAVVVDMDVRDDEK